MLSTLASSIRWAAFSLLNRLADIRSTLPAAPRIYPPEHPNDEQGPLIWLFCSTIGEVNACLPFLRRLEAAGRLVIMTDRHCYREVYQRHFPDAHVVELSGRITDAGLLANQFPPSLFIVCEIPAMPSDAPCRLSYGMLREARKAGAAVHLVNGWLYGYAPACRMDRLEVLLFRKDYLAAFDTLGVQNEEIKARLEKAGARGDRISVTGNMKFDSIGDADVRPPEPLSKGVLDAYSSTDDPVVVAGCLADIE